MSSSNIGRWSAQATLDANGFTSGIQRMTNSLRGFVQWPGGLGMLTSLPSAVGIGSLSGIFSRLQQTLDEEIDLAFVNDQLGTTIEWLSTLRTVASESSIGTQQFTSAMERFNQVIGQARLGSAESLEAFTRLGINLQGQNFEQIFEQTAAALAQVEDRSVRARLAMQLFGRGNAGNILRMVQDIGKAMTDVQGRGGFVTPEMGQRFEDLNRALDKMSTNWNSMWRGFLSDIAPAVTAFVEHLNTIMSGPRWLTLARLAAPQAGIAQDAFELLPQSWQDRLENTWDRSLIAIQGLFEGSWLTDDQIGERLVQQSHFQGALPAMPGAGSLVAPGGRGIFGDIYDQVAAGFDALVAATVEVTNAQRDAARVIEDIRTPFERMEAEILRLTELQARGMLTQDQFNRAVGMAGERVMHGIGDTPDIGSLESGSAEVAAILANANNPQMNVMESMLAAHNAQVANTNRMAELLTRIDGHLGRQVDAAETLSQQVPIL